MAITPGQEAVGAAQSAFADAARAKREELIESGQCEPFTVVNFNPPPLRLQGELMRYCVWSPEDDRLPPGEHGMRVTLPYDGRDRIGHVLTVREPHIYGKNVGATWYQGGGPGDAIPQREPLYFTPCAIAYSFLEHFSPIFATGADGKAAPPPKDARKMFGVLAFKGDIHLLARLSEEKDVTKRVIEVPLAILATSGKLVTRRYRTVKWNLDDYLAKMFDGQLRYADAVISRAQQRFNGTEEDRKDISVSDRVWYRWAIRLGYAPPPKPGERTWLNELLTLTTAETASVPSGLRKCQSCRTAEPEPETPFCPKCGAPINTFDTFMAGFPVAEAWLMALKGEERDIVLAELEIRKQGFGGSPAPPIAAVVSGGRPLTGAAKKAAEAKAARAAAADHIQAAATTAMVGEE
jgi:hypothetical protein